MCQKVPNGAKKFQKRAKKYTKKYMKVQKKLRGGGEFQKDPANAKKVPKKKEKKRKKRRRKRDPQPNRYREKESLWTYI